MTDDMSKMQCDSSCSQEADAQGLNVRVILLAVIWPCFQLGGEGDDCRCHQHQTSYVLQAVMMLWQQMAVVWQRIA